MKTNSEQLLAGCWYSAIYKDDFSIDFLVTDITEGEVSLCREDGIIIDELPKGYLQIILKKSI